MLDNFLGMLASFVVHLTQLNLSEKKELSRGNATIRSTCRQVCGQWLMWEGPVRHGWSHPGQVVLGYVRGWGLGLVTHPLIPEVGWDRPRQADLWVQPGQPVPGQPGWHSETLPQNRTGQNKMTAKKDSWTDWGYGETRKQGSSRSLLSFLPPVPAHFL